MRILVAEDDPLTLEGIKLVLAVSLHEIVATFDNGEAALENLAAARPDMLLLDFDMPKRSGLDVLRSLRERGDTRPIILLTASMSDDRVYEALKLGLNGLVIKSVAPRDLPICVDAVAHGRRWIDHDVLQRVMERTLSGSASSDPLEQLTARQRAIVALVVQGHRNRDIAAELGISEGTIKVHLHSIYDKLGVSNRLELALLVFNAAR